MYHCFLLCQASFETFSKLFLQALRSAPLRFRSVIIKIASFFRLSNQNLKIFHFFWDKPCLSGIRSDAQAHYTAQKRHVQYPVIPVLGVLRLPGDELWHAVWGQIGQISKSGIGSARSEARATVDHMPATRRRGARPENAKIIQQVARKHRGGCARASEEVDYFIHDRAAQKQDPAISANCGEMASPTGFEPVLPGWEPGVLGL